jgi:glycosyltransferase involved in cell wall biosynthesis
MKNGLSIVIPVCNEEEIIVRNTLRVIGFVRKLRTPFEIIIINNGSTDRTLDLAKKLQEKHSNIRLLDIPQKGWTGVAFANAVSIAKYEDIVQLDMDLSSDLSFVSECLNLLRMNYSIVIGSKKVGNQQRNWIRVLMSTVYIFLTKLLLGIYYSDYSIGAKGYKKSAIKRDLARIDKETFYPIQLFYFAKKRNLKIIEIPVRCDDRRASKFNMFYEILQKFFKLISFSIDERLI